MHEQGMELITFGVSKVDELYNWVRLTADLVTIHLGLEEERLYCFVGLKQCAVGLAQDL